MIDEIKLKNYLEHESFKNYNRVYAKNPYLVFLPNFENDLKYFKSFYDRENINLGNKIRYDIEEKVFTDLEKSTFINSKFDINSFMEYTNHVFQSITDSNSSVYKTIVNSKNPKNNAKFFIIQCAGDFLSEASAILKNIFGKETNTLYFDEHTHIDQHHGKMAIENIIKPLVNKFENSILQEILQGFMEFYNLTNYADLELSRHIKFHDEIDKFKDLSYKILDEDIHNFKIIKENKGEVSVSHIHNTDELFEVIKGKKDIYLTPYLSVTLNEGEKILLPKGILHGSIVLSEECTYKVSSLKTDLLS